MDEAVERHGISRIVDISDLTAEDLADPAVMAVMTELDDAGTRLQRDVTVEQVRALGVAWTRDGTPLGCIDVDTSRGKFMYTIEKFQEDR